MLKIIKKEYKPLVEREEIVGIYESKVTPKRADLIEELATQLKKQKDLIVIKHIYQEFGKNESKIFIYVYDSIESLKKFEKTKEKPKEKTQEKEEKNA